MANGINIDAEGWGKLDSNERDRLIYLSLQSIDKRLSSLEGKKWWSSGLAFAGGVVGGIAFQAAKVFK